ncbi:hypothetical protein BDM02DRAFT_3183134 [Thelephora ganbajun]|uniref:Uncharacterized protein n=1 Tax=Thelephora ganbajun TaxID=370292 RepID=A0ACB6ZUB6_THEGA|nr:hypothetical protein BDM02DRAFT_3183134 [Thelephora ganbajun]
MQGEPPPYEFFAPLPGYIPASALASPIDNISLFSSGSQVGEYNYKSDHLRVNLGPRRWGTRFPVYGFQDVVEGTVYFAKKCSHVVSVTATLEGKVEITASQGGSVAAASDDVILSQSVKLFEAVNPHSFGADRSKPSATLSGEFNFALPFPAYITNGRDHLPPSQTLSQQGTYCTINYNVKIDIVRKGLRRHERVTVLIMYLPRSSPPGRPQSDLIHETVMGHQDEEERFVTVDLHSSSSARAALEKLQMSAQLTLPSPKLIAKAESLDIHLIRKAKIMSSSGGILQEIIVSKAGLRYTDNSTEGVSRSHWALQLGKTQRHVSWKVDGLAEVKYSVRVAFKPPPCSVIKQLPAFQHDEVVKLTSDPWLDPTVAEGSRHLPSLGLAPVGLTNDQLTTPDPHTSFSSPYTRL